MRVRTTLKPTRRIKNNILSFLNGPILPSRKSDSVEPVGRLFTIGLLLILPLMGVFGSGNPISPYLLFPPIPKTPGAASFSWGMFSLLALSILGFLAPFAGRLLSWSVPPPPQKSTYVSRFPWWGWCAALWTLSAWILAWTRFPWFAAWQPHTFPFLWFGYIFLVNALTYARSGQCLLFDHTRFFLRLFPLSAGFWWVFEYLNQFVRNWHYVNLPEATPLQYTLLTSLAFSTVLPAVWSTLSFLSTFSRLTGPFQQWKSFSGFASPKIGWLLLAVGGLGLSLISNWPRILFPLLWISPLFILIGSRLIRNQPTFIETLTSGNWQPIILPSVSALVCGFWWELWNAGSLVHWEYSIPYVHGIKIFEMPILGYAGYVPFGLECLAATEVVLGIAAGEYVFGKRSRPNAEGQIT